MKAGLEKERFPSKTVNLFFFTEFTDAVLKCENSRQVIHVIFCQLATTQLDTPAFFSVCRKSGQCGVAHFFVICVNSPPKRGHVSVGAITAIKILVHTNKAKIAVRVVEYIKVLKICHIFNRHLHLT